MGSGANQPDLETLTALKLKEHGRGDPLSDPEVAECAQEISHLSWNSSAMFQAKLKPIISRYLQKARAEASERLNRECDVLKDTNDKLRDQLCANTKLISELQHTQHTVRLVQETHSQHIHECAAKAAGVLVDKFYGQAVDYDFRTEFEAIISETFDTPAKAKDECRETFEAWYKKSEHYAHVSIAIKDYIREGFKAAWKLAKGDK